MREKIRKFGEINCEIGYLEIFEKQLKRDTTEVVIINSHSNCINTSIRGYEKKIKKILLDFIQEEKEILIKKAEKYENV